MESQSASSSGLFSSSFLLKVADRRSSWWGVCSRKQSYFGQVWREEERGGVNTAPFMGGITPASFVTGLRGNQRASRTVPYLPNILPLLSGIILGLSL